MSDNIRYIVFTDYFLQTLYRVMGFFISEPEEDYTEKIHGLSLELFKEAIEKDPSVLKKGLTQSLWKKHASLDDRIRFITFISQENSRKLGKLIKTYSYQYENAKNIPSDFFNHFVLFTKANYFLGELFFQYLEGENNNISKIIDIEKQLEIYSDNSKRKGILEDRENLYVASNRYFLKKKIQ